MGLTGLPPYYTRDREKLFDRIRRGDLSYPAYVTPAAKDLMKQLLITDPSKRLGSGPSDGEEVKVHLFFESIDWSKVMKRELPPPFKPDISGEGDVKYFEK